MSDAQPKTSRLDRAIRRVHRWSSDMADREQKFASKDNRLDLYMRGEAELYDIVGPISDLGWSSIGHSLLAAQAGHAVEAKQRMAQGIARRIYANAFRIFLAKKIGNTLFSSLDDLTQYNLTCIAIGMPKLAQAFHALVFKALEGGYSIENGHNNSMYESLRYAAMGLTIMSDWMGFPALDLDKLKLPRDPVWSLLASSWRNPDPQALLPILDEACSVHIDRTSSSEEDVYTGQFEFGSPYLGVYPAEILAILRLRDGLGLENPVLQHPLMNTPYAQITQNASHYSPEQDALLMSIVDAIRKYDPDMMAQWDVYLSMYR